MAELIRAFAKPPQLSDAQVARLVAALRAVVGKQRDLSDAAPGVAVAGEVREAGDSIELCYGLQDVRSLGSLVLGDRPDGATLLEWARQLCETLAAAYPAGQPPVLRHGGLCGASVVRLRDGTLRVLDFGVAECYAEVLDGADEFWLNQVASNVAPEVWNAPSQFGQQSDIFAVGVLLYELATGKHPFGAIRDDPEDCKYQILIELPVPPGQRNPTLDGPFSGLIFKALRSETSKRYTTFVEMLDVLSACARRAGSIDDPAAAPAVPGPLVPRIEDPARPAVAGDPEQRQEYLAEQHRLREQRERAERLQAERRERTRRLQARLRRHARAVGMTLAVLVLAGSAFVAHRARGGNRARLAAAFDAIRPQLGPRFSRAGGLALVEWLGFPAPARDLVRAIDGLAQGTPALELVDPVCADLVCSAGSSTLTVAGRPLPLTFALADSERGLIFDLTQAEVTRFITEVRDTLASAALGSGVAALVETIQAAFRESPTAAGAEARLQRLAVGAPPPEGLLGYLGYQGAARKLELGACRQVLGDDAVEFEVTAVFVSGGDEYQGSRLQVGYERDPTTGEARLREMRPVPQAEPEEHRRSCITHAIRQIQQAFAARDAQALAARTGATVVADLESTLAWVDQCSEAELRFDEPDFAGGTARARIRYRPGLLEGSARVFETAPLVLSFSASDHWRVSPDGHIDWPAPPAAWRRQQQGQDLLVRFTDAWLRKDAVDYLAVFGSSKRTPQEVAAMFQDLEVPPDQFRITAREPLDAEDTLYIEVRPQNEGAARSFRFVVQDQALQWVPESRADDPLWLASGFAYRSMIDRLRSAPWADHAEIRRDFEASARQDMTLQEQQNFAAWLEALEQLGASFDAVGSESTAGFPLRVQLKHTAGFPMIFRLIRLEQGDPDLRYLLEREVCVSDVYRPASEVGAQDRPPYWTEADRPWETWAEIIGRPPRDQVVGLSAAQAEAFAQALGCQLLTCDEWWQVRHRDDADSLGFPGDVWEYCREPGGDDGGAVVAVGGSWLDRDPEVLSAGHRPPDTVPVERHGTVGFRLVRRITLPAAVLADVDVDRRTP